jgi:hypothetical protein
LEKIQSLGVQVSIFNPSQKITAKIFYNLIGQLEGEERLGAIKALSMLMPVTEDGFMTMNDTEPRVDFFVQCFDVLLSVALALKMAEDDGLVPKYMKDIFQKKSVKKLCEADSALQRIETMINLSPKPSKLSH